MSELFYLLSLKHSPWGNDAVWWRPNGSGYTSRLEDAGLYSGEEIAKHPKDYNNGTYTKAIPESAVLKANHMAVDFAKAKKL